MRRDRLPDAQGDRSGGVPVTGSGWQVYGGRSEAGAPDTVLLARADGGRITIEHHDELRELLATGPLAARLMDGLERVQSRVAGLLHFDANESAPPEDERWAQDLYLLNEDVTGIYVELENAYAAAQGDPHALRAAGGAR